MYSAVDLAVDLAVDSAVDLAVDLAVDDALDVPAEANQVHRKQLMNAVLKNAMFTDNKLVDILTQYSARAMFGLNESF